MNLDKYDSGSYRIFTSKGELDKAIHTLEGILKGISIDQIINIMEIEELQNWCNLYRPYESMHPFNELLPLVDNAIKDNVLNEDEIDDILWLCNNLKTGNKYYDLVTSDIQKLQGLLHGILSDNSISNDEIESLKLWLEDNEHLMGSYPYDEVYSLIVGVLKDGNIDNDERNMLIVFFSEFIDTKNSFNINKNEIAKLKENININGICSICPEINIQDNWFCFTGISSKTSRSQIKTIVESLGGKFHDSITNDIKYLVVGNNGNPCWAFSCYGRKVEKAVQLRKAGKPILIIHENDFWDAVAGIS